MRRILCSVCTLLFFFILPFLTYAAPQAVISLPYFNGWEDEDENACWTMNSGINGSVAKNRWYVSSKEHFTGAHSLLVSDLSIAADTTPAYSNTTVNIIAARTFDLPSGEYDLSFAYRLYGEAGCDGLYVAWIPDNSDISTTLSSLPTWAKTAAPYNGTMLLNRMKWTVERTTIRSYGWPMKLVFMWVNDNKNAAIPSVCIDNVQVGENRCGRPENLAGSVTGNTINLSWTANPTASYEVWYTSEYAGVSDTITNVRGGSLTLPDVPRGSYDIHVRTICQTGDHGIWCSLLGVIVNEGLCLDYADLYGEDVTCWIGDGDNPYQVKMVDDKGINGESPRHTVNTDIYETDPRTGGALKVIPDGEFCSIRLGNEGVDKKGEAIVYNMHLDSGANTVLLMKYAVVLQVPDAHSEAQMPWFKLEILDKDNNLIDPTCGDIYFYSSLDYVGKNGWKRYDLYNKQYDTMEPLIYKDWTTMGVMLGDYAKGGSTTLKIRLTTRDCMQGAHFGYAYFTLDCIEGEVSGITCGDIPMDKVEAPEGFKYKWYAEDDPTQKTIATDRVFPVKPGDVGTYLCDVISKEKALCYFTLKADLMPRFPKAKFNPVWSPEDCQNFVRFNNESYIETREGRTDEAVEEVFWDFGDGRTSTERNPIIDVPREGCTLNVKLRVSIVKGMCYDECDTIYVVPAVGERHDTTFVSICKGGNPYIINGMPYYDTQDVTLPPMSSVVTGCDSIHVVRITAVDSYVSETDTTICAGDTVMLGGDKYCFSGNFQKTFKSVGGCDSVVRLHLTVMPEVTFNVEVKGAMDGPNSGEIILSDTMPGTWYTVNDMRGEALTGLPVGTYTIVCYNEIGCASKPKTVEVTADCLELTVGTPAPICTGDSALYMPVEVQNGKVGRYGLIFSEKEHEAGFADCDSLVPENLNVKILMPESVEPNIYSVDVVFYDIVCGDKIERVSFSVLYPDTIMKQKWNDVVALKNENHNGGYLFTSYQWYRNGVLMPGQTRPYVYMSENQIFSNGDEISVEVSRASDGVRLMSCPLVVSPRTDIFPYPVQTIVLPSFPVNMMNVGDEDRVEVETYTVSGISLGEQTVTAENPWFAAPEVPGIYLLKVKCHGREQVHKIAVNGNRQ